MTIIVTGRHMDVTPALKENAELKATKLSKYYDLIQEIEVVFDVGKDDSSNVEMIVHAEHRNTFIAREAGADAYACLDACFRKLERQITEHKQKFRNRKHPNE